MTQTSPETIPPRGSTPQVVLERLERYRESDVDWRSGKVWAYVFDPGEEAEALIKRAFTAYLSENGLDPTAFPSLLRLENEVVGMAAAHLGGDAEVVGNFTSGGTESIILACKAARDWARSRRPSLASSARRPKIILPSTAHAAFHKAAHYLDLDKVLVDVDSDSFRADVDAMAAAIDEHTIMLVGSAVSYAHCVVDPIPELAALAKARDLWLHVDGCMGGFLLPYMRRLGRETPAFDFGVDGVSSISMDLHKYAFAAKGASVVLYRDKSLRRHQIFTCADWPGYTISNPTIASSKSGGSLAAAWAVLHHFGDAGYLELARSVLAGADRVLDHIDAHADLRLLGRSDMNHVAFTSDTVPIFRVAEALNARDWYVQVQLSYRNSPGSIHLAINPANLRWIDQLLADLDDCVEQVRDSPANVLLENLGAALANLTVDSLDAAGIQEMLSIADVKPGTVPKVGAQLNELLDVLQPGVRERVLTEFMNELFSSPVSSERD